MTHEDADRSRTRLKQDSGPEILALTWGGQLGKISIHHFLP